MCRIQSWYCPIRTGISPCACNFFFSPFFLGFISFWALEDEAADRWCVFLSLPTGLEHPAGFPTNYKPWQPPPGFGNYSSHQNKGWRGIPMLEENADEPCNGTESHIYCFYARAMLCSEPRVNEKGWNHLPITTVPCKCSYRLLCCGKGGKAKDPGEEKPFCQIKFDRENIYSLPISPCTDFSFYRLIWHLGHVANFGQFRKCSDAV